MRIAGGSALFGTLLAATVARGASPEGLGEDPDGKLFIADMRNRRLR